MNEYLNGGNDHIDGVSQTTKMQNTSVKVRYDSKLPLRAPEKHAKHDTYWFPADGA